MWRVSLDHVKIILAADRIAGDFEGLAPDDVTVSGQAAAKDNCIQKTQQKRIVVKSRRFVAAPMQARGFKRPRVCCMINQLVKLWDKTNEQ